MNFINSSIHSSIFFPNLHFDQCHGCYHHWFYPRWSPLLKSALTLYFLSPCPWCSHIHTPVGLTHITLKGMLPRASVAWKWTSFQAPYIFRLKSKALTFWQLYRLSPIDPYCSDYSLNKSGSVEVHSFECVPSTIIIFEKGERQTRVRGWRKENTPYLVSTQLIY